MRKPLSDEELVKKFASMTPEERNNQLQAFFSASAVNEKLDIEIRIQIFKYLINSIETSRKYEEIKGYDDDIFGSSEGRLDKVPEKASCKDASKTKKAGKQSSRSDKGN